MQPTAKSSAEHPASALAPGAYRLLLRVLPAVVCLMLSLPPDSQARSVESSGRVLRVGPERDLTTLKQAAQVAQSGDVVEVDAGDYRRDVALWTQDPLELRAVGGRVRLFAAGAAAESKAIWVVRGGTLSVEGFDFLGARVDDRNGAGIRFEKGHLKVRDCRFFDNENGILTAGDTGSTLDISDSEFGNNGAGDGRSHNLYVGRIARLSVTGSYFHHAKVGHLLKTRAAENHILYNRLSDEIGGTASYELEFPEGGVAYVVGNLIEQSATTENPNIVAYGAEGYSWPDNRLYLVNNTLVDDRPHGGVFLRVNPGRVAVLAVNNLLVGKGKLADAGPGTYQNNFNVDIGEFVLAVRDDYRLNERSTLWGKAIEPPPGGGTVLRVSREYAHPRSSRAIGALPFSPGAFQSKAQAAPAR